jgi:pimeloyl-ACP methyl ester carboxylesterase
MERWRAALIFLFAGLAILVRFDASGAIAAETRVLQTESCSLPDVAAPARCGVLDVPENPDRPDGRILPIHLAVIPAISGKALPDPIVVLMGGPGEDAIGSAAIYAAKFAPLLADRDLLLVDQRGTGQSAALHCDLFSPAKAADSLRDVFPLEAVRNCERRLSAGADLTRYTFPYFANDLEQVRRALGYGQVNLFAGSYGTRAAQVYLRAFPQSVRTAYLGSVVPIDATGPLSFAKTEEAALETLFAACAADPVCHAAFPDLRDEFRHIRERLDSGKVRVPISGHKEPVPLGGGRVAEWFRSQLYRPGNAAALPWMIHRAAAGDWAPIVDGILSDSREADGALSFGLFFAITCSEDLAFLREQDVAVETQGTFLGDYRLRQQQAACKPWPKATLPDGYRNPVQSSVPTLFVTGDLDGGTPLWFTDRVAGGFSNHATLVAHGQGHTEWSNCVAETYQLLVRSGSVQGLAADSCPVAPRPPFKT